MGQCDVWTHLDLGVNGVCFCQVVRCHQTGIWWCAGSYGCNSEGPSQAGVMGWQKLCEIQQEKCQVLFLGWNRPLQQHNLDRSSGGKALVGSERDTGQQWVLAAAKANGGLGLVSKWATKRRRVRGFIIFLCSVLIRPLLHTQYRTDNNKLDQSWWSLRR